MFLCVFCAPEALFNVDEEQLASMDDKLRKLKDEVARLERENQAVSAASTFSPCSVGSSL